MLDGKFLGIFNSTATYTWCSRVNMVIESLTALQAHIFLQNTCFYIYFIFKLLVRNVDFFWLILSSVSQTWTITFYTVLHTHDIKYKVCENWLIWGSAENFEEIMFSEYVIGSCCYI
jgi:hypothetical protein